MPKKKAELDPSEQSKRFRDAAHAAQADESGKAFEEAIGRIVKPGVQPSPKPGRQHRKQ